MKNKIILTLFLGSLLFSCSDSMFEENYSEAGLIIVDENAVTTNADLERSVKGLYSKMSSSSGFGGDHFTFQELTGDIGFVSLSNSGYFVGTNGGTHIQVDGGAGGGLWATFYNTIANANFVLGFEGKIAEDENAVHKNGELFAHAKMIRAYNYLALLSYFSPNYGEGDQTLGVPYPTTYNKDAKLPRESVSTVVNNVITELESVLAYCEENSIQQGIYDFNRSLSPIAAELLLARAYLFKKDYPKAEYYAQKVIDDTNIPFLLRKDVAQFFINGEEAAYETIFQLEFNSVTPQGLTDYWGTNARYKQNFMARKFWEASGLKVPTNSAKRDARAFSWYMTNNIVTGYPDNPSPIDVRKYMSGARDLVQLRKSEAVFIKAEAQFHSNPSLASQTVTNWVKEYRFPDYVPAVTSGPGVLDEILTQKAMEFFLEGLRFSDLKRNNRAIVKYQTNSTGQPLTEIPVGDRRFVWPIPYSEMQNNPNITQAPGY
ncbi:RagB/SusD family nutrient uptake outer membrane protein [Soonwooa purpurea]